MWEALRAWLNGDDSVREALFQSLSRLGFQNDAAVDRLRRLIDPSQSQSVTGSRLESPVVLSDQVFWTLRKLIGLLAEVADPDGGLSDFERYAQGAGDRAELFHFLDENPRAIEILVRLFSTSRYLTETVLRNPDSLRELTRHRRLAELKSREEFLDGALSQVASAPDYAARLDVLRRYQRWELLRIGACDAFGLIDLRAATVQLSLLADSLVQAGLALVSHELMCPATNLTVLALGKLGGEELNYSSDIDLVFLTDRNPAEASPLAQRLVKGLQDTSSEGFLYRVDVRLRPWGRSGELVTTIPSYLDYLKSHAELWERQALLKARVIAGSKELGRELLRRAVHFRSDSQ
jgi:[glutamine synthetase] adenylyltransferase / [glutamine synthetase]-adenylyl-L-tyrosine phosphorylase